MDVRKSEASNILSFLSNNWDKIEEICGKEIIFRVPGISEINGIAYLPLKKIEGILYQKIQNEDFELDNFPDINDASIVISIECHGQRILFTGDSTLSQWMEHKRQMERDNFTNLDVHFLKVPHHGSKDNNTLELYKYFIKEFYPARHLFISTNGISHPHKELFEIINELKLIPHCTNISSSCNKNLLPFKIMPDIPIETRSFLMHYAESQQTPCQGDIVLSLDSSGMDIKSSNNLPCVYNLSPNLS
ncbi:MAG: hypothetical protein V1872_11675 [bacterium]